MEDHPVSHPIYSHQSENVILGKMQFHEQMNIESKNRLLMEAGKKKVYILMTGGTIGMFKNEENKFAPAKNRFSKFLRSFPYFCDEDETYFNSEDGFSITPPSMGGEPIYYKYHELDEIIDSTDMSIKSINLILTKIEEVYKNYDAFIILHGTDTMAYTASALSFMIENLTKTVILTGSQIPMEQTRNDAANNLLCSLTIAGHYSIPQVLLVFDNKVMRGNRSTKFSTASFEAFRTPNFHPLGDMELSVKIKWEKVFPCNYEMETKFVQLTQSVEIQKLTPFGFQSIPSSKYVVIESFGIGNVPTHGPFYDFILENSKLPIKDRKILVNISQVYQSVILNEYHTGNTAFKLGMIPGSDMTCEAAISKLSYLVTKGYTSYEQLLEMMGKNLRGELTEEEDRSTKQKQNYIINSMTVLDRHFAYRAAKEKEILVNAIYTAMVLEKPSKAAIYRLQKFNFDVHKVFPDNTNLLHRLMQKYHEDSEDEYELILDFLLKQDVDAKLIDNSGNSAAFYALEYKHYSKAEKILKCGGILQTTTQRVFAAIREQDLTLLHALAKFGDKFQYVNSEGRNCAFYAVIIRSEVSCAFFKNFTNLFNSENLEIKDVYGWPLKLYLNKFMPSFVVDEESAASDSKQNSDSQK